MTASMNFLTADNGGCRMLKLRDDRSRRIIAEVTVTEAVYRAYYQEQEHASYLTAKARQHELSWNQLEEERGMPVDAHLAANDDSLDEMVRRSLYDALETLTSEMREALWQLVCGETTERALAKRWGISQPAVHRRKQRALRQLREQMERALHRD